MLFQPHTVICSRCTGDCGWLCFLGDANLMCVSLPLQLISEHAEVWNDPQTTLFFSHCLLPVVKWGVAFLGELIFTLHGIRHVLQRNQWESFLFYCWSEVRCIVCTSEKTILSASIALKLCRCYKLPIIFESRTQRDNFVPRFFASYQDFKIAVHDSLQALWPGM